jgi:hypothetical protein
MVTIVFITVVPDLFGDRQVKINVNWRSLPASSASDLGVSAGRPYMA